jgi:serine protease Do
MLQFSAPVVPGFSGGPLVDADGSVVGIVAVRETEGTAAAFGFAIPLTQRVQRIIERMLTGERVRYGYLGVEVSDVSDTQARETRLNARRGALVHIVESGSPADEAGMTEGDVVTAVGGVGVDSADAFVQLVGDARPGERLAVEYVREGVSKKTKVVVTTRGHSIGPEAGPPVLSFRGAEMRAADSALRERSNLPAEAMIVTLVHEGSPADEAGLAPGDIVLRIGGKPPSAVQDDDADALVGLGNGGSVVVRPQ